MTSREKWEMFPNEFNCIDPEYIECLGVYEEKTYALIRDTRRNGTGELQSYVRNGKKWIKEPYGWNNCNNPDMEFLIA